MRFSIFLLLFAFTIAQCKTHVRALTESMGQEVIEIGAPVRDLPPGLEEEPSAEFEDEEKTLPPKRENRKTTTQTTTTTQKVATELRTGLSQEDEERRIEKELSEIYKDTDYKAEVVKNVTTVAIDEVPVPVLRQRGRANFKFQPDVNDRADVERFRTSVDDISCEKRVTQRLQEMVSIVVLEPGKKLSHDTATSRAQHPYPSEIISLYIISLLTLVCQ